MRMFVWLAALGASSLHVIMQLVYAPVADHALANHTQHVLPVLCSKYAEMAGPEMAAKYQTILFLAGSASAEFFADIGLCPFEAVKVGVPVRFGDVPCAVMP